MSALDKCKISDRAAIHVIIAVAEALGHDIDELVINRSTLQRQRELNRIEKATEIKNAFKVFTNLYLFMLFLCYIKKISDRLWRFTLGWKTFARNNWKR